MKQLALLIVLSFAMIACGDEVIEPADPQGTGAEVDDDSDLATVSGPLVSVITELAFARLDTDGQSMGIDVDGLISGRADTDGCRTDDMESPQGDVGVDNAMAELLPALDAFGANAIEDLALEAINDGRLLLLVQVDGVDDLDKDEDITVTVARGAGEPLVGNDGFLEWGQTFDVDDEVEVVVMEGVTLEDGWATAGPFEMVLPLQFFQHEINLDMRNARIRFQIHDDGVIEGFISGGMPIDEIIFAANIDGAGALGAAVAQFLPGFADLMGPTGECDAISTTILFDSALAFFYDDVLGEE